MTSDRGYSEDALAQRSALTVKKVIRDTTQQRNNNNQKRPEDPWSIYNRVNMAVSKAFRVVLLLLLSSVDVQAKIKRVAAGKKYTEHESVHIVVNKIG